MDGDKYAPWPSISATPRDTVLIASYYSSATGSDGTESGPRVEVCCFGVRCDAVVSDEDDVKDLWRASEA